LDPEKNLKGADLGAKHVGPGAESYGRTRVVAPKGTARGRRNHWIARAPRFTEMAPLSMSSVTPPGAPGSRVTGRT